MSARKKNFWKDFGFIWRLKPRIVIAIKFKFIFWFIKVWILKNTKKKINETSQNTLNKERDKTLPFKSRLITAMFEKQCVQISSNCYRWTYDVFSLRFSLYVKNLDSQGLNFTSLFTIKSYYERKKLILLSHWLLHGEGELFFLLSLKFCMISFFF